MSAPIQKYIRGESAVEIAESLETAIQDGRIAAGSPLPTVRGLARARGLSPTTVAAAYRALRGRGLLVTEGRRGTRVSPAPPIATHAPAPLPAGVLDLATGNPDAALLPALGPVLGRLDPAPHLYAEQIHLPELLDAARAELEGDRIPVDGLSVVSGAMDGIERVLLAHLRPGDRVAVEDPGFTGVLHLVRAMGLVLVPVQVDDDGPLAAALDRALTRGARACVLTPRAQNPTGAALSPGRVRELRRVLARHPDVLVVEDDHAGVVAGAPARTLCGRQSPHWAVIRSVSKALGPDLRLALLAGDRETVSRVEGRQLLGLRWVSHILQRSVVELWRDPGVGRLLERAEATYTERRAALLTALSERGIPAHGRSGLNVWIPVQEETLVVQRLQDAGYAVRAGEVYRLESPPAVRITTAALPASEAPALAEALARILSPSPRTQPA